MVSRRHFLSAGMAGLSATALAACRQTADQVPEMAVPGTPDDAAWATVRAQFATDAGVAYLNNASLGMPPAAVARAVADGYLMHSRDPIHAKHELSDIVATRSIPNLARFLGARPDEIALTRNATEALHLAAVGLALRPGDEVLMTTQEHPAGARPWRFRNARHAIDVQEVFIPSPYDSGDQVIELISERVSDRTRAIAFCHVTRGGHLYPVKRLCSYARDRGIATVVDGAQAVGMFPVDLHDLGCDAYAASLHKWLLGPIGTGVFYVREDARPRWQSAFEPQSRPEAPGYAPGGTADLPLRAAIDTAVGFLERVGIDAIAQRNRYLSNYLKDRIARIPGSSLVSGPTPETSAPGSSIFVLDGVDPSAAVAALEADGLHIDEHDRDGHPAIRVSTHCYNTTDEVDRVVEALTALAA